MFQADVCLQELELSHAVATLLEDVTDIIV
jgi:hypothetical protein